LKRIALLAVIGAGMMALPSTAAAKTDCTFANGNPGPGGPVVVYGTAVNGDPGAHSAGIGVCVDTNTTADGGYAEVGQGFTYAIIDGSDANGPVDNPARGYAGLDPRPRQSDTSIDPDCDGSDDAAGSHNTGGCFWIKPAPADVNNAINDDATPTTVVTDMFICGNTSGASWGDNARRDGCSIP
jgi:hypothetical protein